MPTIRPCSITTREPRFSFAMVLTASTARPAGSMLRSRLPLTRKISLTCMTQKTALCTGGAQGIGRSIAQLLVRRGYDVAIADVKAPAGRESGFLFLRTDVSSEPSVRACVRAVVKRFGRLDALVNNAGIAAPANGP